MTNQYGIFAEKLGIDDNSEDYLSTVKPELELILDRLEQRSIITRRIDLLDRLAHRIEAQAGVCSIIKDRISFIDSEKMQEVSEYLTFGEYSLHCLTNKESSRNAIIEFLMSGADTASINNFTESYTGRSDPQVVYDILMQVGNNHIKEVREERERIIDKIKTNKKRLSQIEDAILLNTQQDRLYTKEEFNLLDYLEQTLPSIGVARNFLADFKDQISKINNDDDYDIPSLEKLIQETTVTNKNLIAAHEKRSNFIIRALQAISIELGKKNSHDKFDANFAISYITEIEQIDFVEDLADKLEKCKSYQAQITLLTSAIHTWKETKEQIFTREVDEILTALNHSLVLYKQARKQEDELNSQTTDVDFFSDEETKLEAENIILEGLLAISQEKGDSLEECYNLVANYVREKKDTRIDQESIASIRMENTDNSTTIPIIDEGFNETERIQVNALIKELGLSYYEYEIDFDRDIIKHYTEYQAPYEASPQEIIESRAFYENFWHAPLPVRVGIIDQLLLSSEEKLRDRTPKGEGGGAAELTWGENFDRAFNFVADRLFPVDLKYANKARKYLELFCKVIPDYHRSILLASMIAAGQKAAEEEVPIGKRLMLVMSCLGAGMKKLGQSINSYPLTPEEIKTDTDKIKYMVDLLSRWDLIDRIEKVIPKEYRDENYARYGQVKGAASYQITLIVDRKDETQSVLSIQRENAAAQAKNEFCWLKDFTKALEEDEDEKEVAKNLWEIIEYSESRVDTETHSAIGAIQVKRTYKQHAGLTINVDGYEIKFSSATWRAFGDEFREQTLMEGVHFHELPEDTEEEMAYKKAIAKARVTAGLLFILEGGESDDDIHKGNSSIDTTNNVIGVYDNSRMSIYPPNKDEKRQLVGVLTSLTEGGIESISDFQGQLSTKIKEERIKTGQSPSYLIHIQNTLLALNDFIGIQADGSTKYIELKDLQEMILSIINYGTVDKFILQEVLAQSNKIKPTLKVFLQSLSKESLIASLKQMIGERKVKIYQGKPVHPFTEPEIVYTTT